MHQTQYLQMARSVAKYMPKKGTFHVLEVGSRNPKPDQRTHRELMAGRKVSYLGIDLLPGYNVDLVMPQPYTFPVPSGSVDFLLAGAVFEHIPFVWATMLEVGRVLKPGGHAFVLAPSRGHEHNVYDCWRYYPDGYRALASWAGFELLDVYTDLPPRRPNSHHFDYAAIDHQKGYWGDSTAVFRKPTVGYPTVRLALLRRVVQAWANAHPDLENIPRPPADPGRAKIHAAS